MPLVTYRNQKLLYKLYYANKLFAKTFFFFKLAIKNLRLAFPDFLSLFFQRNSLIVYQARTFENHLWSLELYLLVYNFQRL